MANLDPIYLSENDDSLDKLIRGFSEDRSFFHSVVINTWSEYEALRGQLKENEAAFSRDESRRFAEMWQSCVVFDILIFSATVNNLFQKKERVTDELILRGTWWPCEVRGTLIFRTPLRSQLFIPIFDKISEEENRNLILALVGRNFRIGAPLFAFPCPECGEVFLPKRRGQLYHSKACAHKAGQRRRYREKKLTLSA